MKIGLITAPETAGELQLKTIVRQVVAAERDGFSSYWFVQLPHSGYDPLVAITAVSQHATQIELGTAVVPIYGRHPLALAHQANSTQVATNGRLTLGIGLSHKPVVEQMMGLSYTRPASYMREYLSILQSLLKQEVVNQQSETFKIKAQLKVPDWSPSPILVAALAPIMLGIAGELADGTVTWMAGTKTIETHIAPRIVAAADKAGRPAPRICVGLPIAVTDDKDMARAYVVNHLGGYGQLKNYRRLLDIEGVKGPEDVAIIGNETEVEKQLRALANVGATDFIASIFPVGEAPVDSMDRTRALLKSLIPTL